MKTKRKTTKEETMTVDAETLARLDDIATDEEIARLEKILVMEVDAAARELNMITTRVVLVWKKRQKCPSCRETIPEHCRL